MFLRHRSSLAIALFLTLPTFAGCAADKGDPAWEVPGGARLEIIGSATRTLNEHTEHQVEVRYVSNAGAVLDGVVDFGLEGSAGGATLSGRAAPTDADGVARITLRTGSQATFDLVAVAPGAAPAVIDVNVQQMRFGNIEYQVTYAGRRPIDSAEVALFTNITCDELNRTVPAPRETQVTALRRTEKFEAVEVGVPVALYALGIDPRDNVAAEACADVRLEGTETYTEILLGDTAEIFAGEYRITETFDVTAGFHPTLDLILDIMSGIATDPAAYVVDFVATHPSTPGWLRTALGSRVTRDAVAGMLRDAISGIHVPGYLVEVAEFGRGVDTAFTQLTFDGTLIFGEADEFGVYTGTHRITKVSFPTTHDGMTSERPIGDALSDVVVTVGPTISLEEHSFDIAFGQVVEMIINDVLLPRVPGSPATTGELFRNILDCDAIARRIGGSSSTTTSIANSVCDIGLTLLGGLVEGYLVELWQYDNLTLSGTADLIDSDQDYDRDLLRNGRADALWSGSDGMLEFDGVFAGSRVGDGTSRRHVIRERMSGLR